MKHVTITTKKWRSFDGLLFDSKQECAEHERQEGYVTDSEMTHRCIQAVKACHGPYLSKSFREYNLARERAESYLKGYVLNRKSKRTLDGTKRLGEALIEYAKAWQTYKNALNGLKTLRERFAKQRTDEKAERDKEVDNG